ncbi:hypothetical protein NLI96_g1127 [Meripilus lineatus]|uniref:Cyanate lyase C-terminal domain-containing protein n=1 Tax=Meripilus lineatus TaxID=2056292 RepID=A0AAD5YN35_9APHY|nr:hypothetical protein NLI96_g1127 [Physisporinus lineatus]
MSSSLRLNATQETFRDLPPICAALFEAKARKGITFEAIGKAIGRDEVWVASAFYGQVCIQIFSSYLAKLEPEELLKLAGALDIDQGSLSAGLGNDWWPRRGLGPMPPTDPVLYRLYEGVLVYGNAIKFGDGIMSMIDCEVHVDKKPSDKGDRVVLTFDGKFLPYKKW